MGSKVERNSKEAPLKIHLLRKGVTPEDILEQGYEILNRSKFLGFCRRENFLQSVKKNEEYGTIWVALWGDERVVGIGQVQSRVPYPHVLRHGESEVLPEFRGRKIGTWLYFAQVCTAILEGRRELEVHIIPQDSPWMSQMFLPSLGYSLYGTLPRRTSGFKDIQVWGRSVLDMKVYIESLLDLDSPVQLDLIETPKTQKIREENLYTYKSHRSPEYYTLPYLYQRIISSHHINLIRKEGM